MRESITGQEGETREVNAGEEIICRQKEKHKSTVMTDAELRKAYNDGYDGYYEDLLPVDHGRERFETDSAPVKRSSSWQPVCSL